MARWLRAFRARNGPWLWQASVARRNRLGSRGCRLTPGDRGSGTIWVACVAVIVTGLMTGVAVIGVAQGARHRAAAAADLAALAGAQVALLDPGSACVEASVVAVANGAVLSGCSLAGEIVVVSVVVEVQLGRWGVGSASATARAGPVDDAVT